MPDLIKEQPDSSSRWAALVLALRRAGVTDTAVISAMEKVERARFIPQALRHHSFEDSALDIGEGQTISQPSLVGLMSQSLNLSSRDITLEVGTGSGYQTMILSHLCRFVYSIERIPTLLKQAEQRFRQHNCLNIVTHAGDGSLGWATHAPFDKIMVTAASPDIPAELLKQLKPGGIMVVPVGPQSGFQSLLRITHGSNGWQEETLAEVRFVPLVSGPAS